jgi:ABC-type uncharacterized transport system involved in gliding motility auxiliary subunit
VNLTFFYSERPSTTCRSSDYGNRVRELLQELAARSNGNLRLP